MVYPEQFTQNKQLQELTLAVDIGSAYIKAAVYDEGVKTPQPVIFNTPIPDFIPSAIYIPEEEVDEVLFGCDAMNKLERDTEGILYNINRVIDEFAEEVTAGTRPSHGKQAIINNVFSYIKEQAEQLNLNGRTLSNCVVVTEEDTPIHRKKILLKAAKAAGFNKVDTMSRIKAIINYWLFAHDQEKYNQTRQLLIADIQSGYTNIKFLVNNGTGFDEVAIENNKRLDIGCDSLATTAWDNLISEGTLSQPNRALSDLEKIKEIKSALNDTIFNARPLFFNGTILDIPAKVLEKTQKSFCKQLKAQLSEIITSLGAVFSEHTTDLMIVGNAAATAGVKGMANEICPGNSFIPDHPEFTAALGGCVPDDPDWLKKQNLLNKLKLAPGVQFGVYSILRSLGKGGMGEVWLAHHETMDIPVAIKVVHSHLTKSSDSIERFMGEIRNTAKLRHPNIVRAHDAGCLHGINYLVSDYVNGVSLSEQLEQKKYLEEEEVLKIGRFIADALKYAWEKHRILHRDIKPDNIMIDNEGNIMLMDMGIAKSLLEKAPVLTADDTLLGTPHYMSPEQIRSSESDFRSDIYSLGATLFHLATGSRPYEGESIINVATKHLTDEVPNAAERNPDLSEGIVALLQKMMAKKTENREQSWQDVIDEIDLMLYGEPVSAIETIEYEQAHPRVSIVNIVKLTTFSLIFLIGGIFIINKLQEDKYIGQGPPNQASGTAIQFSIYPKDSRITVYKSGKVFQGLEAILANKTDLQLPLGTYTVLVARDGYKSITEQVDVKKGDEVFSFSLAPYLGSIGILTSSGAVLTIRDKNGKTNEAGTSDKNGEFWLNMQTGAYQLQIEKEDYVTASIDLNILRGTNPKITVPLKLKGGIARLESKNTYDIYLNQVKIGSTNHNIKKLYNGTYYLEVKRDGFLSSKVKVTITDEPSLPIKIKELTPLLGDIVIAVKPSVKGLPQKRIPRSAQIRIDDSEWQIKQLPYSIKNVRCKKYKLEMKVNNFTTAPEFITVNVEHNKQSDCNFIITPKKAPVIVMSDEEVPLYLNGKKIANTNETFLLDSFIDHKVTAHKDGYRDVVLKVTPQPDKESKFKLPALEIIQGDMIVKMIANKALNAKMTMPKTVEILINGGKWKEVSLPLKLPKLPSRNYTIKIRAKNYRFTPEEKEIHLKEKTTNEVSFEVEPHRIPIIINSNVKDADIYDSKGKFLGKTGQKIYLMPFLKHELAISKKGYKQQDIRLLINKLTFEHKKVSVVLEREHGPVFDKEWNIEAVNMKMKPIKKGSFYMGDKRGKSDEKPVHKVTLAHNFWISETAVTQKQFKDIMGYNPSPVLKDTDCSNHPVVRVSWKEAITFCRKLSELQKKNGKLRENDFYTLPTEAEWEYCCKAGTNTLFHYGNELTSNEANFDGQFSYTGGTKGIMRGFTTKVGSFKPNKWGLYDMHGNVWEWCLDTYSHSYHSSPQTNPSGPDVMAGNKVLRGGSWKSYPKYCRSTARYSRPKTAKDNTIGFRIVLKIVD